jgi:hypothetical protein
MDRTFVERYLPARREPSPENKGGPLQCSPAVVVGGEATPLSEPEPQTRSGDSLFDLWLDELTQKFPRRFSFLPGDFSSDLVLGSDRPSSGNGSNRFKIFILHLPTLLNAAYGHELELPGTRKGAIKFPDGPELAVIAKGHVFVIPSGDSPLRGVSIPLLIDGFPSPGRPHGATGDLS